MSVRITCISKSGGDHENPHTAIRRLGWINEENGNRGSSTRLEMYDWIKEKSGYAYVRDNAGNQVGVGTAETQHGTKYVRTYRVAYGPTTCLWWTSNERPPCHRRDT